MNIVVLFVLVGFLILTGLLVTYFWIAPWRFIKHSRKRLAYLENLAIIIRDTKREFGIEDLNAQEISYTEVQNKIQSSIEIIKNSPREEKTSGLPELVRNVQIMILKTSLEELSEEIDEYHEILETNAMLAFLPIKLNLFNARQHKELDKITDRLKSILIQLKNL